MQYDQDVAPLKLVAPMADIGALPRFFIVFLSESCTESLAIPPSFNQHLRNPLPRTAKLQGCGPKVWKVSMRKRHEYIYFTIGWREFAEENDLTDGEFLTFVYDGSRTFEVSIYNRYGCKEIRGQGNQHFPIEVDDGSEAPTETDIAETGVAEANSTTVDLPTPNLPNPCFETKVKNRKYELLIPRILVKDYDLRFGSCINYIDEFGILPGIKRQWKDRICFQGWDTICKRNNLKDEDTISCELLHNQNLVHSIKITIIRSSTSN